MKFDSRQKHDEDFSSFNRLLWTPIAKLPVDTDKRFGVKYPFLCFVKVQQNAVLFNNSYSDITLETFKLHWSLWFL